MLDPSPASSATVKFIPQAAETIRSIRVSTPRALRMIGLAPLVLFALGLAVIPLIPWSEAALPVLGLWVCALLLAWYVYLDPRVWGWWLARTHPEQFHTETIVTVNGDGVHTEHGAASSDRTWEGVTDWMEDREFIVLRQNRVRVAVIPKRAFAGRAEMTAFIAVLKAHVPRSPASIAG